MVEKWDIMFPVPDGEERRGVYVYLPESYGYDWNRRYPVLYMFDGHNVFFDTDATYGKCWGMKEYMDYTNTEMIIAAVECNHSADNGRLKEYSPWDFYEKGPGKIEGRGKATMDWMSTVFKEEIDRRYRTIPDREHTCIAGSSMGGLMSLYGVIAYNEVYSRAAALSPSIWTSPAKLQNLIRKAKLGMDTIIYMDYGSDEPRFYEGMQKIFAGTAAALQEQKVYVTSRIVPGGTHCEACWEKQIPFFMQVLQYSV